MKTVDRYILGSFLVTFALAFAILSFVLTLGVMARIARSILEGVPAVPVLRFAAFGFHETLQLSIPLSLLFASVLFFSRLAIDNEWTAFRACGFSPFQIVRAPLAAAFLLTVLCAYLNFEILPRERALASDLRREIMASAAVNAMEPGHVVSLFPQMKFIFDERREDEFIGFQAWDRSDVDRERQVSAERVQFKKQGDDLSLVLKNATVDPIDKEGRFRVTADAFHYVLQGLSGRPCARRDYRDMRLAELCGQIRSCRRALDRAIENEASLKTLRQCRRNLSFARQTLAKRLAFAVASFLFALVGMGLGLRSRCRHSTAGFLEALALAIGYYLFIILVLNLDNHLEWRPEFLVGLAPLALVGRALCFMRRAR